MKRIVVILFGLSFGLVAPAVKIPSLQSAFKPFTKTKDGNWHDFEDFKKKIRCKIESAISAAHQKRSELRTCFSVLEGARISIALMECKDRELFNNYELALSELFLRLGAYSKKVLVFYEKEEHSLESAKTQEAIIRLVTDWEFFLDQEWLFIKPFVIKFEENKRAISSFGLSA